MRASRDRSTDTTESRWIPLRCGLNRRHGGDESRCASPIEFGHLKLELDPRPMVSTVAKLGVDPDPIIQVRNPTELGNEEPSDRVVAPGRDVQPSPLRELINGEQPVNLAIMIGIATSIGLVVLVGDLADQILDQILQGDDASRSTVFVDHDGQLCRCPPQLGQRQEYGNRFRKGDCGPDQLSDGHGQAPDFRVEKVANMHEAEDIVGGVTEDRISGVRGIDHR